MKVCFILSSICLWQSCNALSPSPINAIFTLPTALSSILNTTESNVCINDLDMDLHFFAQIFGLMTKLPIEPFTHNQFDHVFSRWTESSSRAEHCISRNHVLWKVHLNQNEVGVCLPKSCHNENLVTQALNRIAHYHTANLGSICADIGCKVTKMERLGIWRQLRLDVAIIAFPRSGTSAMFDHLLETKNSQFTIPGVNILDKNVPKKKNRRHIREDAFFGYNVGWQMFPTWQQVQDFNARHFDFETYRNLLFGNKDVHSSHDVYDGHSANSKKVIIKNPDYLSMWWVLFKLMMIPNLKFVIQLSDLLRWFDYEINRSVLYKIAYDDRINDNLHIFCKVAYNSNDEIEMMSVAKCIPGLIESILNSKTNMANLNVALEFLLQYTERHRVFYLHKDWLDHNSTAALASLENFLNVSDLGSFPLAPKKRKWFTDICTTPLYQNIKHQLERQYPFIIDLLKEQGHWIPPRLEHRISSCDNVG